MLPAAPGIARIVAPNGGPMTGHGTNTIILDGTIVVDPGPDDADHVRAILDAVPRPRLILLTHAHRDHAGAAATLRARTGAVLAAFAGDVDRRLADGDAVEGWTALHTPGHAADHLCFARDDVVLTGDHVMTWASSLVEDVAAYLAGLRRLLARPDRLYVPGHGPPTTDPQPLLRHLIEHRLGRESALLGVLGPLPTAEPALRRRLYPALPLALHGAATANLRAHLRKLEAEGRAAQLIDGWIAVR